MNSFDFNIGGILLMMNGIEPIIRFEDMKPEKRKIPIVYFASSKDMVVPIEYVWKQVERLWELKFNLLAYIEDQEIGHYPVDKNMFDRVRTELWKAMK